MKCIEKLNVHDFLFRFDKEKDSDAIEFRMADGSLTAFLTIERVGNYLRVVIKLPDKFEVDVDVQ